MIPLLPVDGAGLRNKTHCASRIESRPCWHGSHSSQNGCRAGNIAVVPRSDKGKRRCPAVEMKIKPHHEVWRHSTPRSQINLRAFLTVEMGMIAGKSHSLGREEGTSQHRDGEF